MAVIVNVKEARGTDTGKTGKRYIFINSKITTKYFSSETKKDQISKLPDAIH